MPSTDVHVHSLIFYPTRKIEMKIRLCVPTFGKIEIGHFTQLTVWDKNRIVCANSRLIKNQSDNPTVGLRLFWSQHNNSDKKSDDVS